MINLERMCLFALSCAFSTINLSCGSSATNGVNNEATAEQVEKSFCMTEELKRTTALLQVEQLPIYEQLALTGKIEYDENDLVAFRSLLEGIVDGVNFELGDYVRTGQVLASIKSTQIQELQQQRLYQRSQIALLEKQLKAKQELTADGLLVLTDLIAAEHELESAKIELERIEQGMKFYKATGSGTFQILAPKDGYIIQKSISSGQSVVGDSDPLFAISNLKQVWVMVNIYASNLRFVQAGDPVKVRTLAYPDQLYEGKIDKIYNVFDDNEHVLKARVVLDNPNLKLMPGLSADILINKLSGHERASAIPLAAKIFHNNKEYVVVHRGDCELEIREIQVRAINDQYCFVAENFTSDERVVGNNALLIFEALTM